MKLVQNENGFTLIEAMIATMVLSVGILTLITMQITSIKGNARARGITTASTWVQDRIEQLIASDYDTIASDTDTSPDGHYSLSWTVQDDFPTPNAKRIEVMVNYDSIAGPRSFKYATTKVNLK